MGEIVQKENQILREIAKPIPVENLKSRRVETIVRRMIKALDKEEDGIAIAAPQIGESLRIFVVSQKIFELLEEEKVKGKSKRENLDKFEKQNGEEKVFKDMVFINPEILKTSKKKMKMEEGCLSVRWLYGNVERSEKTLIKAYDENGKLFTMGGSGLLSQVFQHEMDHLEGVLFIDKAKNLREIIPQKIK
jgi:peptide deformylase